MPSSLLQRSCLTEMLSITILIFTLNFMICVGWEGRINMPSFARVIQIGWKVIDVIVAMALILMIALVFINVVLRYAFFSGILGSVEMSRYLFVWIVMLSAVSCVRYNEHLSLPVLTEIAPPLVKRLLSILCNAVICFSGVMLCIGGYLQAEANWSNLLPMSALPVGLLYFSGAVSGTLMAVLGFVRIFFPNADSAVSETVGHA